MGCSLCGQRGRGAHQLGRRPATASMQQGRSAGAPPAQAGAASSRQAGRPGRQAGRQAGWLAGERRTSSSGHCSSMGSESKATSQSACGGGRAAVRGGRRPRGRGTVARRRAGLRSAARGAPPARLHHRSTGGRPRPAPPAGALTHTHVLHRLAVGPGGQLGGGRGSDELRGGSGRRGGFQRVGCACDRPKRRLRRRGGTSGLQPAAATVGLPGPGGPGSPAARAWACAALHPAAARCTG